MSRDARESCGRTWPSLLRYGFEHACVRDLGHEGSHECECGRLREQDGADDDRVAEGA